MTWLLSIWDERGRNVLTASVTDPEMIERLKTLARDLGLRVQVKEQPISKVVNP